MNPDQVLATLRLIASLELMVNQRDQQIEMLRAEIQHLNSELDKYRPKAEDE